MKAEPIHVTNLSKVFYTADGRSQVAIEQLTFNVSAGETIAIVGRTGCGKSTFLNLLVGLDSPTEGRIDIGGKTPYGDFKDMRKKMAVVFQQDRLLPWRSAMDNVTLGLETLGIGRRERLEAAKYWLQRLGLGSYLNNFPHQLSGGMRQRVAIARAFAICPSILVADEAFGHLDEATAKLLRVVFSELIHEEGNTGVVVTHQLEEAIEIGDRVIVFAKPARVRADFATGSISSAESHELRIELQRMLNEDIETEHDPKAVKATYAGRKFGNE
jgi:NitT/TauT family transport system ATP-binding protein